MPVDQLSVKPSTSYIASDSTTPGVLGGPVSDGVNPAGERQFSAEENRKFRNGVPLHPQPTTDPLDPLNWSKIRKYTILAIVMWL